MFDEDMPGFGLRLRAGGSAVWVAQYRVGAKQRRVTLGRTATLDPDRARRAAREVLCKAGLGQDAQAERRDRQAKAAVTFGAIVQTYLKAVEGASKGRTHGERRRHLLLNWKPFHARSDRRDHAQGCGCPPAGAGGRARADRLEPGEGDAERLLRLGDRAGACRQQPGDRYRPGRDRALARAGPVGGTRSATSGPPPARTTMRRILKLLLLTGQRRGEVAGMTWGELDLDRAVWSMPAGRTKNGLPHDVPLSQQAVALLRVGPATRRPSAAVRRARRALLGLVQVQGAARRAHHPPAVPSGGLAGRWRRASARSRRCAGCRGRCTTCAGRW